MIILSPSLERVYHFDRTFTLKASDLEVESNQQTGWHFFIHAVKYLKAYSSLQNSFKKT